MTEIEQQEQKPEKNFRISASAEDFKSEEKPPENKQETKEDKEPEKKPEVTTSQTDERFQKFWSALGEQANQVSQGNFEKLIVTDEYQYNGAVYKAKRLTYKEKHELDALQDKARTLSEKENWEQWIENQKQRAILLIEGMTPERFDQEDSYILTQLISAWGLKPEGFRDLFKSP